MSYSTDMMSLHEMCDACSDDREYDAIDEAFSGIDEDIDDAISEEVKFGEDKMTQPSDYGLKASIKAADQFTHAGDGEDIDLSFHSSFDDDDDDFSDFNTEIPHEDIGVDINTIPATPDENDQFDMGEGEDAENANISDSELASDDDDGLTEAFNGYEDLF